MTVRLARLAVDAWPTLDGYAAAHGMPPLHKMPLDRFSNFVWHMATRHLDEPGVEKLRARLWQPPRGQAVTDSRSPWAPENETKGLTALKMGLGLSGVAPGGAGQAGR